MTFVAIKNRQGKKTKIESYCEVARNAQFAIFLNESNGRVIYRDQQSNYYELGFDEAFDFFNDNFSTMDCLDIDLAGLIICRATALEDTISARGCPIPNQTKEHRFFHRLLFELYSEAFEALVTASKEVLDDAGKENIELKIFNIEMRIRELRGQA